MDISSIGSPLCHHPQVSSARLSKRLWPGASKAACSPTHRGCSESHSALSSCGGCVHRVTCTGLTTACGRQREKGDLQGSLACFLAPTRVCDCTINGEDPKLRTRVRINLINQQTKNVLHLSFFVIWLLHSSLLLSLCPWVTHSHTLRAVK